MMNKEWTATNIRNYKSRFHIFGEIYINKTMNRFAEKDLKNSCEEKKSE